MIKNYTSGVPPERSVNHIEKSLVGHGARNILKDYDASGTLSGIAFIVEINGKSMPFKIPARVGRVEARLKEGIKRPRNGTMAKLKYQASKTAWKLLADWVDIQMSLIDLDQVEMLEVFLPYAYDAGKKQTFFEKVKEGSIKLLNS
jgi:hypothetical protein